MLKTALMFVTVLIPAVASADPELAMVSRLGTDTYSVVGEADPIRTLGCTVSADRMRATVSSTPDGRLWITFIDADGEEEASCELETAARHRPIAAVVPARPVYTVAVRF